MCGSDSKRLCHLFTNPTSCVCTPWANFTASPNTKSKMTTVFRPDPAKQRHDSVTQHVKRSRLAWAGDGELRLQFNQTVPEKRFHYRTADQISAEQNSVNSLLVTIQMLIAFNIDLIQSSHKKSDKNPSMKFHHRTIDRSETMSNLPYKIIQCDRFQH